MNGAGEYGRCGLVRQAAELARLAGVRYKQRVARQASARGQNPSLRLWSVAPVLFLVTMAIYANGLAAPFLLDDPINITKNPQIERPLDLVALLTDPRAVVTASLRWNYLAGGFSVTGYHVLNAAVHAVTGCLVLMLSWLTLRLPVFGGRYESRAIALSTMIAAVFLLHPIQTESVTYVIQRAEIFVSAAMVGSLVALIAMHAQRTRAGLALLAASCVLGAYSKPSFAVVPALLAVFDLCFLSRGQMSDLVRRWPAYAVALAASVWTFVLARMHGSFEADTAGFDLAGITPLDYLSAQFGVVVHYLRVTLWPNDLCFDCGYRGPWPVLASPLGASVVVPAAILVVLAAVTLALWRRFPLATFAFFASAVVLAPTSTFIPLADFYVEHRMYLPIAFLAMALVPAAGDGIDFMAARLAARRGRAATGKNAAGGTRNAARIPKLALAALVLIALAMATTARNRVLSDPVALMEDALVQAPQNERVQFNLANAYRRLGRLDEAIPHYEAAIRLLPNVVRSYENLGSLYLEQGRLEDALRVFVAGAAAKPDVGMAHRNVATAFLRLGRADQALAAARRSIVVEPDNPNGHRLVGASLEALGRLDEAAAAYRSGLQAVPGDRTLTERLARLEPH